MDLIRRSEKIIKFGAYLIWRSEKKIKFGNFGHFESIAPNFLRVKIYPNKVLDLFHCLSLDHQTAVKSLLVNHFIIS